MSVPEAATKGRAQLAAEFATLYVVVPLLMAFALPPTTMFPMLFAVTLVGIALLHRTPGFRWLDLLKGRVDWIMVALFGLSSLAVGYAVIRIIAPGAEFALARRDPARLAMIFLLYPLLSALPQELLFRPLFFRRYAALLPRCRFAIVINAAVFSLAHLMYWSWIVAVMTFAGGLVFAAAYELRRSFPFALALHAVAGWAVFGVGLGILFYSGNVGRPF
ncbi:CPBP family intramembrane glutamic endopeptidase [Ostreiculturibacter nitratireducens]|uniref:CPBP family intramembrane glutamic endopeptidase n=1 Tax=Ostreiculturibacter nitratireducens TaxID=3075226 RepID=UPI0031B5884B